MATDGPRTKNEALILAADAAAAWLENADIDMVVGPGAVMTTAQEARTEEAQKTIAARLRKMGSRE